MRMDNEVGHPHAAGDVRTGPATHVCNCKWHHTTWRTEARLGNPRRHMQEPVRLVALQHLSAARSPWETGLPLDAKPHDHARADGPKVGSGSSAEAISACCGCVESPEGRCEGEIGFAFVVETWESGGASSTSCVGCVCDNGVLGQN